MPLHITRKTELTGHVIQFASYLRDHGFRSGTSEVKDLLQALKHGIPFSFEEQIAYYRSVFVKNRREFLLFDDLYHQYWEELSRAEDSKTKEIEEEKEKTSPPANKSAPTISELKNWLYNGRIEEEKETAAYSAFEALGKKDFSHFLASQRKDLSEIIRILAKRLAFNYNRRYEIHPKARTVDIRSSIREALRKGGDITAIQFKQKQIKKTKLILICDVSRSMELYSQFLIEFMYGFQQSVFDLRTYVFSTQLVALTNILKDGDYDQVLQNLADHVPYWSGGTRIGESLSTFTDNNKYFLNSSTIVMILSDGWDTGDIDLLTSSMKFIKKKTKKVIWLNPLAGHPDYQPETAGMKACMPYIDIFDSGHNVESLKGLVSKLKRFL